MNIFRTRYVEDKVSPPIPSPAELLAAVKEMMGRPWAGAVKEVAVKMEKGK